MDAPIALSTIHQGGGWEAPLLAQVRVGLLAGTASRFSEWAKREIRVIDPFEIPPHLIAEYPHLRLYEVHLTISERNAGRPTLELIDLLEASFHGKIDLLQIELIKMLRARADVSAKLGKAS